jgi:hypothetical protein
MPLPRDAGLLFITVSLNVACGLDDPTSVRGPDAGDGGAGSGGRTNDSGGAASTGGNKGTGGAPSRETEAGAGDFGTDASTDGGSDDDGATDAAVACGSSSTRCSTGCKNLLNDAANCGVCGHACGGGECSLGACQAQAIVSGINPQSLAVDGTTAFFTVGPSSARFSTSWAIQSCPVTGCKSAPDQPVGGFPSIPDVAVAGDSIASLAPPFTTALWNNVEGVSKTGGTAKVIYTGRSEGGGSPQRVFANTTDVFYQIAYGGITRCKAVSGGVCASTVNLSGTPNPSLAIAATDSDLFFIDSMGDLKRCPLTGICDAPTTVVAGVHSSRIRAQGNLLYLMCESPQSPSCEISTCPQAGCTSTTKVTDGLFVPSDFAVGVYWLEAKAVRWCKLPDCPGGPRTIKTTRGTPSHILASKGFIYWLDPGAPSTDGGTVDCRRRVPRRGVTANPRPRDIADSSA